MMDTRKLQDKVLEDLENEMGDRRAGVKRQPILSIDISAIGEDEGPEEEAMEGGEEELPEDGAGWTEYLKKRYPKG